MQLTKRGRHVAAIFAVVLGSAVAISTQALGDTSSNNAPPPVATAPDTAPPCTPMKKLYSHRNWRDAHPLRGEDPCASSNRKKLKKEFFTYRIYRRIAHFPGLHEGDPYLEYLPLPAYVVLCETRGYYGEARWHAANSAGALGPAQVLSSWHPKWPIRNNQDKVEYWKMVHELWGNTGWDCA